MMTNNKPTSRRQDLVKHCVRDSHTKANWTSLICRYRQIRSRRDLETNLSHHGNKKHSDPASWMSIQQVAVRPRMLKAFTLNDGNEHDINIDGFCLTSGLMLDGEIDSEEYQ
ncbi:hypothetical protein chiPu_0020277 [Chiloscyllium punctatum]|uniref:Uncharacterized protein n=1 Tax=Chiloscyllium punctatum TaxID=137246 RepID=A0A401RUJ8_CHIPU|nr:hypothetical protein [Chiloscyllium punctatum]